MATFFLRGQRTEKQIWVRVKNQGKEIRLPIGATIPESLWSTDTQRPKRGKETELSNKLTALDDSIIKFMRDLRTNGGTYDADDILTLIESVFPRPVVEVEQEVETVTDGIVPFIGSYIESLKATDKRDTTVRCMGTFKGIIERFIKECEPDLTWDTIDGNTGEKFDKWMRRQGYSLPTINKQRSRFRTVAHKAGLQGLHHNVSIDDAFKNTPNPTQKRVYLNSRELLALAEMELDPRRSVYRDIFLIQALSGQRISDCMAINKKDIHTQEDGTRVWMFKQTKTGTDVQIALIGLLDEVFAKYDYQPPQVLPQVLNRNIKSILHELSETIPSLQEQYEVIIPKHGKVKAEKKRVAKWESVSNHTGRRSMVTNMINSKAYSNLEIMSRSGHKTMQAFEAYKQTTLDEVSNSVAEIQRKRESEAKAKGEKLLY